MAGKAIFLGVYCDGAEPEFSGSAKDANGDFATVGDKEFLLDSHVELLEELRSLEAGEPTTEFAKIDFLRISPVWLKVLTWRSEAGDE